MGIVVMLVMLVIPGIAGMAGIAGIAGMAGAASGAAGCAGAWKKEGLAICPCMYFSSCCRSSDPENSECIDDSTLHCGAAAFDSSYSPTPAKVPISRWISFLAASTCSSVPAIDTNLRLTLTAHDYLIGGSEPSIGLPGI